MDRSAHARLARLTEKARAHQWDLDKDINWELQPRPRRWVPTPVLRSTVSQLHHGERAAAAVCETLREDTGIPEVKAFLGIQIVEETRHAAAYLRYVDRIGGLQPVAPALQASFDAGFSAPGGIAGKLVGCHLMLESEAINVHEVLANTAACPLLASINRQIGQDEARHIAFGKILARELVRDLSDTNKQALTSWAKETWLKSARAVLGDLGGFGVLAFRPLKRRMEAGWKRQHRALIDIGLVDDAVIPPPSPMVSVPASAHG